MFRLLKVIFWIVAAMAMALESSASPCAVRADMRASLQTADESTAQICHDMTGDDLGQDGAPQAPDHERTMCCCAGLLGSGIALDTVKVDGPLWILAHWQAPLPEVMRSRLVEHEPPPPRV